MELTTRQIEELAKPFVGFIETITSFYSNEENEKAFQEWLKNRKEKGNE